MPSLNKGYYFEKYNPTILYHSMGELLKAKNVTHVPGTKYDWVMAVFAKDAAAATEKMNKYRMGRNGGYELGKVYWSDYWRKYHKIVALVDQGDTHNWSVTSQWSDDGHTTTHFTARGKRDREASEEAWIAATKAWNTGDLT